MPVAEINPRTRYEMKGGKYSSHALLADRFASPGRARRVLDVGCAEGQFADLLARRGYTVTGIDWPGTAHPETIESHGADLDGGLAAVGGSFDYIVCADVLEHLRETMPDPDPGSRRGWRRAAWWSPPCLTRGTGLGERAAGTVSPGR